MLNYIIESVDSISRNGLDTPIYIIHAIYYGVDDTHVHVYTSAMYTYRCTCK